MERMHTALDLSERDNARLRADLSKAANAGVGHEGGVAGVAAGSALAAAAAAAAVSTSRAGPTDDLFARCETRSRHILHILHSLHS